MSVQVKNPQTGIISIHEAERLEINLDEAEENIENMKMRILFNVKTFLNGIEVAPRYWDLENPLILTCENNPKLAEAMKIIQEAIGHGRYMQITAPSIPEFLDSGTIEPLVES